MAAAEHGAIATSDPRATEIGARVLREGGNALDAAVAAAFALYVVEPQSCGPGGDAFLIHSSPGEQPVALDGAGVFPAGLSEEALRRDGLDQVPARGGRTVTVPGALSLLEEAVRRFGTMELPSLVAPAVELARDGFDVRPSLAATAERAAESLADDPVLGPLYAPEGKPVQEGRRIVNPALGECLETVARDGSAALYSGPIGEALVDRVRADGGYLTLDDLRAHETLPMELLSVPFRDSRVWELPQPTQGPAVITALEALGDTPRPPWEAVVDAVRVGMREAGFDPAAIGGGSRSKGRGDTSFIACIDGDGRGASLITSVFGDFGAHLGVEALGGPIHNRATTVRLARAGIGPGKPPHTIIPSLVTSEGDLREVLGVAGGLMQPQTQVQILVRMLDYGMTPQEAIDAPRFKIAMGGALALEEGHELASVDPDAAANPGGPEGFGGAQVASNRTGELLAGADPRRGGSAIVF